MVKRIIVLDGEPASIRRVPRAAFPQAVSSLAAGSWHLVNTITGPNAWTVDEGASVPDQPVSGQWSVVPGDEPGEVIFTVINLNGDGGGAITAHERQVDDGPWVELPGGGATGPRSLMRTAGVEYTIRYRRRNALGPSLPSDPKTVKAFFNPVALSSAIPSLAMTQGDAPITLVFDDFVSHATEYVFGVAAPSGITYSARGLTATADALRSAVSIPVTAIGAGGSERTFQIAYAVSAAVDPGDDPMVLRGDQTIVAAQTGGTWAVIEPYDLAGTYTVPSTAQAAKSPRLVGIPRAGNAVSYTRALWWYDDDLGQPQVSFQALLDNNPISGAPVTDPGSSNWSMTVTDTMRNKALKIRETLTVGGVPFTVETTPLTISNLPEITNADTFPHSVQSEFKTGYVSDSGIPWTRLGDQGGVSGAKFTGAGELYAVTSAGNARFVRRGEQNSAEYMAGAVLQWEWANTAAKTGALHGIYPTVRMPRNPTDHTSNQVTGITCVFNEAANEWSVLRYVKSATPTVLTSFPNAGFGFEADLMDPESKPPADVCLWVRPNNTIEVYINGVLGTTVTDTVLTANTDIGFIVRGTNHQMKARLFYGVTL